MPTIDRSVTTYTRKKRAELLTTFRKWNPNKRVEGPRSQSNIPYTEMKLATGFSSSTPAPLPPEDIAIEDIANDDVLLGWVLKNPNTTITSNQTLSIFNKQVLRVRSGETFTNNGTIINDGGINTLGTFSNYSIFQNDGDITLESISGNINNYGVINNVSTIQMSAGTFTNYGRITNTGGNIQVSGGTFNNNNIISNNVISIISVSSIFQINPGIFSNSGTIYSPTTNTGCGIGTITGIITGNPFTNSCPPA
jgi:hypothetical protein